MILTVWLVVLAAASGLLVWAVVTVRELKRDGLEHTKPYGLDSLRSSIRWFAIFPILGLLCAGVLSTAPLLTSASASEASIVTALTGVEVPAEACCDASREAIIGDARERFVAGVQSLGTLTLAVVFAAVSVRMGRNTVALARKSRT